MTGEVQGRIAYPSLAKIGINLVKVAAVYIALSSVHADILMLG